MATYRALLSLKSSLDDPDSRLSSWTPITNHLSPSPSLSTVRPTLQTRRQHRSPNKAPPDLHLERRSPDPLQHEKKQSQDPRCEFSLPNWKRTDADEVQHHLCQPRR
ncbi:hypothetical protein ACLB2K_005853 [Fragaria x ananassa]